jgi:hypothetical protein
MERTAIEQPKIIKEVSGEHRALLTIRLNLDWIADQGANPDAPQKKYC